MHSVVAAAGCGGAGANSFTASVFFSGSNNTPRSPNNGEQEN
ncbi:hypothetical protein RA11412_0696 [Rothia aeria]|jgi:hypothetical protein|uniref:Uncharacterized protein n=1 Tax=Rothia aeria TaxID=172042 RepID=A0A2Z5QX25_9MICC|nr:hypothetical protein RA11412_0696 [Rothia aeria]